MIHVRAVWLHLSKDPADLEKVRIYEPRKDRKKCSWRFKFAIDITMHVVLEAFLQANEWIYNNVYNTIYFINYLYAMRILSVNAFSFCKFKKHNVFTQLLEYFSFESFQIYKKNFFYEYVMSSHSTSFIVFI